MTINTEDLINSIMASFDRIDFIRTEDIPNLDLYMDQVTGFIDSHLKNTARYHGEERILTKTMINNYAKNDLLPPPEKKKYNKEHIIILIFIYYFKNILSINDIQNMLHPITEKYFGKDGDITVSEIYDKVISLEKDQLEGLKRDVLEKYKTAQSCFEEAGEDQEFLQTFCFICLLTYDVYVKKLLIEKMIDGYMESNGQQDKKKEK